MTLHRLQKINELLKQELANILLVEGDFEPGTLVTILDVKTASDLRQATAVFSVWPNNQGEKVLKKIKSRAPFFQQLLIKKLKMHPVPKISFSLNSDEAQSQDIDILIAKIKKDESRH